MQTKIYQDIKEHKNLDFRSKITYSTSVSTREPTSLFWIVNYSSLRTLVLLNIIGTRSIYLVVSRLVYSKNISCNNSLIIYQSNDFIFVLIFLGTPT